MKFAGFPKFAVLSLVGVLALALAGCGGTNNLNLTEGNWSVAATSTAPANSHNVASNIFYIGGNLTQNKSTVTGEMYVTGSNCNIPPSQQIAITGTVKDKKVTLTTQSFQGQVITVDATGTGPSDLTGTYTVTGGMCDGDQGTVTAVAMPSITGTWSGPINPTLGVAVPTLSLNLTQSATASEDGTFPLTGTVTYTNSSCSVSGTISNGSLAGQYISSLHVNTIDQNGSAGEFFYENVVLDSASAPKNMTGDYDAISDLCGEIAQTITLTKQ